MYTLYISSTNISPYFLGVEIEYSLLMCVIFYLSVFYLFSLVVLLAVKTGMTLFYVNGSENGLKNVMMTARLPIGLQQIPRFDWWFKHLLAENISN